MNHSGDANKMVSETPRTDAALMYSICLDLQDENNALKDRIKRLEEAGDRMADLLDGGVFMKLAVQWHEAKEAKP